MRRRLRVRSRPSTRPSTTGVARLTSSTSPSPRHRRAQTPPTSCGRPSAACSGRSSTTSSTSTCGCASTAWIRSIRRRRSRSGIASGSTCSTTTSSRCPTSGSTPGTRHGIWPFTPSALTRVDPDFAKHQLSLMLKARYQHANGQIPAYEWNFGDVNPPVHAWATIFQYRMEQAMRGEGDLEFLKRAFGKLLINFTWWVNRKDRLGKSVFEGGFLGLDNIGVFDRSAELPTGGHLEQADGTAWMAMFCQNMFEIAIELAAHDPSYDDLVFKFAEHFLWIGAAMNRVGHDGMWDEEDGFYYDVLRLPDGRPRASRSARSSGCCRSAPRRSSSHRSASASRGSRRRSRALRPHPGAVAGIHPMGPEHTNAAGRAIAALVDADRLAADPRAHARRRGVSEPLRHPLAVAVSRAAPLRLARRREGIPGGLYAGRVGHRRCSAATPTGAVRCGCR